MATPTTWTKRNPVPGRVFAVNGVQAEAIRPFNPNLSSDVLPIDEMKPTKHKRGNATDAGVSAAYNFDVFQESTSDVWSADDPDLGIISPHAAESAAATVLERHHTSAVNNVSKPETHHHYHHHQQKMQGMQRLAVQKPAGPLPGYVEASVSNNEGAYPLLTSKPTAARPASGAGQSKSSLYPKLPTFNGPEIAGAVPPSRTPSGSASAAIGSNGPVPPAQQTRFDRLNQLLNEPTIDMYKLNAECWKGIPHTLRPKAWRVLSGLMPTSQERQQMILDRKRAEYFKFVEQYYHTRFDGGHCQDTFRQIHIDIPRMCPIIPLFQQKAVQEVFERILYIYAIRHPASGYVQGINDLVTPFFVVFLSECIKDDTEVGAVNVQDLPKEQLDIVEADSFWCVSRLLETIQDNYTFAQPGLQSKLFRLAILMERVDNNLHQHLMKNNVTYLQFAFRWMNNLLMREIPLRCTIRLWDTYLSEDNGFAVFHVYVCAAFLRIWSAKTQQQKEFQILYLLQNLPTSTWDDQQICELTADAYSLMQLFEGSKQHLAASAQSSIASGTGFG